MLVYFIAPIEGIIVSLVLMGLIVSRVRALTAVQLDREFRVMLRLRPAIQLIGGLSGALVPVNLVMGFLDSFNGRMELFTTLVLALICWSSYALLQDLKDNQFDVGTGKGQFLSGKVCQYRDSLGLIVAFDDPDHSLYVDVALLDRSGLVIEDQRSTWPLTDCLVLGWYKPPTEGEKSPYAR